MGDAVGGDYDVVVVGGGPAGLQAALVLARRLRRVLVLDANRPRHAATLEAHGFLTRDNIAPNALRAAGRESVTAYEDAEVHFAHVRAVRRIGSGATGADDAVPDADLRFEIDARGLRGAPDRHVRAAAVVVATGLREILPDAAGLRAYYGTGIHSCVTCDAWNERGGRIAVFGGPDAASDVLRSARRLVRFASRLTVVVEARVGAGVDSRTDSGVRPDEDACAEALRRAGAVIVRGRVVEAVGERAALTGVRIERTDGSRIVVGVDAAFVAPRYEPVLDALDGALRADAGVGVPATGAGSVPAVDASGRTRIPGLYVTGELLAPGPQLLVIAAGNGARTALAVADDLDGVIAAG